MPVESNSSKSLAFRRAKGLSIQTENASGLPRHPDDVTDGETRNGVLSRFLPRRQQRRRIRKMYDNEKIYDHFLWKDVIQENGDGGKVVVCQKKMEASQEFNYVLKIRAKTSIGSQKQQEEFRRMLMKMLNIPPHLGVMPYLEVLEDATHFYCVMEKAAGGSLLNFLVTKHADGCVPELEVKELMWELLQAVDHVHKQGMIHRDIKPDNIVVRKMDHPSSSSSNGKVDYVTLIDFDHAETNYSPCTPAVSEHIWGTTGYNAPETYVGLFSPASDLFSIGVTLYMLMTGKMPYDVKALGKEIDAKSCQGSPDWCRKMFYKMIEEEVDWSCDPWPQNELCRSFCQCLLAPTPKRRPASVEKALQHDWFANMHSPTISGGLEAAKTTLHGDKLNPVKKSWEQTCQSQNEDLLPGRRRNVGDVMPAIRSAASRPADEAAEQSQSQSDDRLAPLCARKNVRNIIKAMRAISMSPELPEAQHGQLVLPVAANKSANSNSEEELATPLALPAREIKVEQQRAAVHQSEGDAANSAAHSKVLLENSDLPLTIPPSRPSGPAPLHRSVISEGRKRFLAIEGHESQLMLLTPESLQPFGVIRSKDMRRRRTARPSSVNAPSTLISQQRNSSERSL